MGSELKTLKELTHPFCATDFGLSEGSTTAKVPESYLSGEYVREIFKKEIIKYIRNLQSKDSIYPEILEKIPDEMKGECAKNLWNNTKFRYGAEYGMIAILMHIFNISEEEIYGKD